MPSTSLEIAGPVDVRGAQRPRVFHAPAFVSTSGDEVVELAAMAGLELDDWQQFVLRHSLGERPGGAWSAPTIGLVCPRQNGKNAILEARELAGLFLFGEKVIVHSAHEQATASEQFRRLLSLIEAVPEFSRRMRKPIRGKGSEAIELTNGQRILFKTRTGGGGRGFSIDCVVFDEAYELSDAAISAIVPALSARPNTQRWYTSSAVDQEKHQNGVALTRQRERGLGGKPNIAYFEWSVEGDDPGRVDPDARADPAVWADANPALGSRIALETVQNELDGEMGPREFAVERLGVGDWPDITGDAGRVIGRQQWADCAEFDESERITSKLTFALDGNPDQTWSAIGVAGTRGDSLPQFAIVDHRRGTDWLLDHCVVLKGQHPGCRFIVDARGPLSFLIEDLEREGVRVLKASTEDYGNACATFFDLVTHGNVRYPAPQPELEDALGDAKRAPLGDRWKWMRRAATSADISPLVAVTLALWGATRPKGRARAINPYDYV